MADQDTKRLDETIPGGDYLAADGKTRVDAWGNPIERTADEPKPAPKRTARKGSPS